jgi:hypothetical protein
MMLCRGAVALCGAAVMLMHNYRQRQRFFRKRSREKGVPVPVVYDCLRQRKAGEPREKNSAFVFFPKLPVCNVSFGHGSKNGLCQGKQHPLAV